MRKRFYFFLGGAFLALGANPFIGPLLGLEGAVSMLVCSAAGGIVGYAASVVFDVFMSDEGKMDLG